VRVKSKLLTSAGVIVAVSAGGMASVFAAAPPPVDVTADHLSCDTVTGSIKFPNALLIQGSPGVTSNQPTVSVALDGCSDSDNGGVIISATKFKLVIQTDPWVAGTHCQANGLPTTPTAGTGTHTCHQTWAIGGKFDNADHPTDDSGNFGANGFGALAGASSASPSNVTIIWKCAGPLKAKCIDTVHNVSGKPTSDSTIQNNYGATATDPFGVGRGAFFVGSPLNGTTQAGTPIPAGTLQNELVSGAFSGGDSGHSSTFVGMLQQSVGALTTALVGKGTKLLTFGVGVITSG
jgi:hypothetical protein